jgi:hypothetical protein
MEDFKVAYGMSKYIENIDPKTEELHSRQKNINDVEVYSNTNLTLPLSIFMMTHRCSETVGQLSEYSRLSEPVR